MERLDLAGHLHAQLPGRVVPCAFGKDEDQAKERGRGGEQGIGVLPEVGLQVLQTLVVAYRRTIHVAIRLAEQGGETSVPGRNLDESGSRPRPARQGI